MAKHPAKCPKCGNALAYDPAAGGPIVCGRCQATLRPPAQPDSPAQPDDPLIGRSLGEFEILGVLGRGGMGAVYKARQASLGRLVAVKVLPETLAADESFVERFGREARSAAAVRHPNIIEVYAVGEDGGNQFIAMEFIDGENLADVLRREGRLSAERALEVMRHTASALAEAHECGILHRDIKPSNILIDRKGRVKVADFGLAKQQGVDVSVTATGAALGTPLYMPPESAQGEPLDPRSDLYSLGATFYQALAGKPPFDGATPAELAVKHVTTQVPPLQQIAPDVPPALCRIVHRLLRKNPAERYESADKLLEALDRVEARLAGGTSPSRVHAAAGTRTLPPASRPATRRQPTPRRDGVGGTSPSRVLKPRVLIAGSAALLLIVIVLLVLIPRGKQPLPKAAAPGVAPSRLPRPASPARAASALERNAAVVFRNIQTCIGKKDWERAEAHLARLRTKYRKTKLVAARRSEIAALRKQIDTALAPTSQPPKPAPPKPRPPQPKPLRPTDARPQLPADDDPRWVRLLPSPTKLVGWRVPSKGATYADGVVELTGRAGIQHEIEARDMIIRAKAAKLAGKNLTVGLRHASGDNVKAWFNGGNFFGINKHVNSRSRDLATGHSKRSYATGEFVDLAFGSRRGRLVVWVAGERVIDVPDALAGPVSPVLTVFGDGRARFKDVRVLLFDKGRTPPAPVAKAVPWKVYTQWPFHAAEAKRRQAETAKALGVAVEQEIELKDGVKLTLVLIPAGEFVMGTAKETKGFSRRKPEHPQHRVRLTRPFWLGKFEVTQEQWLVLMGRNPNGYPCGRNRLAARFLTWQDCRRWFGRLGKRHAGREFRFPTEAEWEYACRAGAATVYPFGDDKQALGEYAWTGDPGKQQPVGQKRPNVWGLHDMLGNVQEWCYDRVGVYDARDQIDPRGPTQGRGRARRSGSRPAYRDELAETSASNVLGFRAAMSVQLP